MYTMLTGQTVHRAETVNELLLACMMHPPAPIRTLAPGLNPALAAVIDQALAFDKNDRFACAGEMLYELERAVRGSVSDAPAQGSAAPSFAEDHSNLFSSTFESDSGVRPVMTSLHIEGVQLQAIQRASHKKAFLWSSATALGMLALFAGHQWFSQGGPSLASIVGESAASQRYDFTTSTVEPSPENEPPVRRDAEIKMPILAITQEPAEEPSAAPTPAPKDTARDAVLTISRPKQAAPSPPVVRTPRNVVSTPAPSQELTPEPTPPPPAETPDFDPLSSRR
jgi:hypothetical protein